MRNMTLKFTNSTGTFDMSDYGVLQDARYTPPQPVMRFVEIPGSRNPVDVTRAATGLPTFTNAVREYDIAFTEYDTLERNNTAARWFATAYGGTLCTVESFDPVCTAEVEVTKFERVGEYVLMTIKCTVVG